MQIPLCIHIKKNLTKKLNINRLILIPDDGSTILQEVTGGKSVECVQDVERTYRDVELVENKVSVGVIVVINYYCFCFLFFCFLFLLLFLFLFTCHRVTLTETIDNYRTVLYVQEKNELEA